MNICTLCPRKCAIDRDIKPGFCHAYSKPIVNIYQLHFGEEPIISGTNGSGTVFFSGCNLGCIFCQNHDISTKLRGQVRTPEELASIYLELQNRNAHNINLVTPMHFAPEVADSIRIAKTNGLTIPVAINTGSYDLRETLQMFDGLVDIYMPDFKFWSSKVSQELSLTSDYKERAIEAIAEMYRQVGNPVLDDDGMLKRGMIVRHLHLPSRLFDSKHILEYLANEYGNSIYISLMSQYTPMPHLNAISTAPSYLKRSINSHHYDQLVDLLCELGQENAFIQSSESIGSELIPDFT